MSTENQIKNIRTATEKSRAELNEVKKWLKIKSVPTIRRICAEAGLSDKETNFLIARFRYRHQNIRLSDDFAMSERRLSSFGTAAMRVLDDYLFSDSAD